MSQARPFFVKISQPKKGGGGRASLVREGTNIPNRESAITNRQSRVASESGEKRLAA
jgi:hypothetical protein